MPPFNPYPSDPTALLSEAFNQALTRSKVPLEERAKARVAALPDNRGLYDLDGPDHFKIKEMRGDRANYNWVPFSGGSDRRPFAEKRDEYNAMVKAGGDPGMGGPQMSANELANARLRGQYASEDRALAEKLQTQEASRENGLLQALTEAKGLMPDFGTLGREFAANDVLANGVNPGEALKRSRMVYPTEATGQTDNYLMKALTQDSAAKALGLLTPKRATDVEESLYRGWVQSPPTAEQAKEVSLALQERLAAGQLGIPPGQLAEALRHNPLLRVLLAGGDVEGVVEALGQKKRWETQMYRDRNWLRYRFR